MVLDGVIRSYMVFAGVIWCWIVLHAVTLEWHGTTWCYRVRRESYGCWGWWWGCEPGHSHQLDSAPLDWPVSADSSSLNPPIPADIRINPSERTAFSILTSGSSDLTNIQVQQSNSWSESSGMCESTRATSFPRLQNKSLSDGSRKQTLQDR